jgi:hypothetical protein
MTQAYPYDTVKEQNHETSDAAASAKPQLIVITQIRKKK